MKEGPEQLVCFQVLVFSHYCCSARIFFLTTRIPIQPFQADMTIFMDACTQGWGAHLVDSQISGTWSHADLRLHINCLWLKAHSWLCVRDSSARGPPGHDCCGQHHSSVLYQQAMGERSYSLLHLVVDLFLWLHPQDLAIQARHILGCLNVIANCLYRPSQVITTE